MSPNLLLLFLLAFAVFAIAHTIVRVSRWPFAAYDLFCEVFPYDLSLYTVVLDDCQGRHYTALPGQVVPIEYCRTNGLIGNVYVRGSDSGRQHRLAQVLLAHLNERPWRIFDEVSPSIRPLPGRKFVRLRIYHAYFRLRHSSSSGDVAEAAIPLKMIFDSNRTGPAAS